MTKNEAQVLARLLNGLMRKVRANQTPTTTDSEGNIVAHSTALSVEEIEADIELLHVAVEGMAMTDEEREAEDLRAEQIAVYYEGLGNLRFPG